MPYVPSKKTDGKAEDREILDPLTKQLADGIAQVSKKYGYDGAFLGELNYSLTRLLQHLPRSLCASGQLKTEIKYWLQAGLFGVLLDVMLEYKVRVNQSYEIKQILKSGDCYDTPFYSKPVAVKNNKGDTIGYVYINMEKSNDTFCKDILDGSLILHN
jgi:hypothetical protein